MKLSRKIGLVVAAATISIVGAALHSTGNAGAAATYTLTGVGGASTGTGTTTVETAAGILQVQVDLSGARPSTSYRILACYNGSTCVTDSNIDVLTSDAGGSIHNSVALPPASRIDTIRVASVSDVNDVYSAALNGLVVPPFTTAPQTTSILAPTTVVTFPVGFANNFNFFNPNLAQFFNNGFFNPNLAQFTNNGFFTVPTGNAFLPGFAGCPFGFRGPVAVPILGGGGLVFGNAFPFGQFPGGVFPFGGGVQTITINC